MKYLTDTLRLCHNLIVNAWTFGLVSKVSLVWFLPEEGVNYCF